MVEFQKNKWKYATICVMGFLAILVIPGAIFPQANAASDTTQLTQQILNTVKDIQTKVNTLTTNVASILTKVTAIQAKTDNLPLDPASASGVGTEHTIVIEERHVDPADGDQETLTIIPHENGKSYSGHMSLAAFGLGNIDQFNSMIIFCQVSGTTFTSYLYDSGQDIEYDFSCIELQITVLDNSGGTDAGPLELNSVVQYTESSDVTVITDP